MKHLEAEDELGRSWIVFDGDTAWNHCQRLTKAGIGTIILGSQTLLSGKLVEPTLSIDGLTAEHLAQPELRAIVARTIRLRDCHRFLEEHNAD